MSAGTRSPALQAGLHGLLTGRGWTIPDGYLADNVGHCRSCHAEVLWALTPNQKKAPLDRDGTNHFATCPTAAQWRRDRKAKADAQ